MGAETHERPLAGISVLVPRAEEQAEALSSRIRDLGGEPVEAPTIEIVPGDEETLATRLREVADGRFAAVCLTSPNGVRAVAHALERRGLDASAFAATTVAVVGPGTARVLDDELGLAPDLVPGSATTRALAAAFPAASPRGARVLLPRADIATPLLPDGLRAKGYEPVLVAAYRTVAPDGLPPGVQERLARGEVDLIAFTSSSTVRHFAELVGDRDWSGTVVAIGPVTAGTCRELDIDVEVVATEHTLDGLTDALVVAARTLQ